MTTALVIPTQTDGTSFYSIRTTLSGADYQLDLDWSSREGMWYVTTRDSLGALLIGAKKLVVGVDIFRYYHHIAGVPAGELVVLTSSLDRSEPGYFELGESARCQLVYREP
jgi:hypothetical protein